MNSRTGRRTDTHRTKTPSVEIVVIGASLGGMSALQTILAHIPRKFPVALVIVLHRDKDSDDTLIHLLQMNCLLPVIEVEDKGEIIPGHVYISPPDYHLIIDRQVFTLSLEAPIAFSRPSIDVLFETASDSYSTHTVGIILTGANDDGARGLAFMKKNGDYTIAQDPATAECPIMPSAAISATAVDKILPLDAIGPFLVKLVRARPKH